MPLSKMNIRSSSMLSTSHSWAITLRSLLTEFEKAGHTLYLENILVDNDVGVNLIPSTWQPYFQRKCEHPDIDLAYTLPRNFKDRFLKTSKLKLAIYNYETDRLPKEWLSALDYVDYVLPSSQFSKDVFVNSGWDEQKCVVIPHGVNPELFQNKKKIKLSNKSFKFLNISIPHYRKNIHLLVEAYYDAFTSTDDVCLVIKTSHLPTNRKRYAFECDVLQQISEVQKKYFSRPNLPYIELIQDRISDMIPLYNSCDVLISASSSEGFGLPLLEGLAADLLVIAPRCSGQLDFLNDNNSLLVDVKQVPADFRYQYWKPSAGATTFLPVKDSLVSAIRSAFQNRDKLQEKFQAERLKTIQEFTWEKAAQKILNIR